MNTNNLCTCGTAAVPTYDASGKYLGDFKEPCTEHDAPSAPTIIIQQPTVIVLNTLHIVDSDILN